MKMILNMVLQMILIEAIKELNKKVIKLEQDLNYYKNYNS